MDKNNHQIGESVNAELQNIVWNCKFRCNTCGVRLCNVSRFAIKIGQDEQENNAQANVDNDFTLQMSVEVERKFVCNANSLKTLEEIGVCAGQDQFQDRYFDTPQFDLTLRDVWLRQRKGRWELKCPAATLRGAQETREERAEAARLCTRYKEMTNVAEIHRKLTEVLKDAGENDEFSTSECCHQKLTDPRGLGSAEMKCVLEEGWAAAMNLVCFAEFTTVRRTFAWEEDGVHVDLDEADFGYRVGEIEVLIAEGGDVQAALDKIERTAKKLGVTGDQVVDGKMSVYLQRNYPAHYARLRSRRIL